MRNHLQNICISYFIFRPPSPARGTISSSPISNQAVPWTLPPALSLESRWWTGRTGRAQSRQNYFMILLIREDGPGSYRYGHSIVFPLEEKVLCLKAPDGAWCWCWEATPIKILSVISYWQRQFAGSQTIQTEVFLMRTVWLTGVLLVESDVVMTWQLQFSGSGADINHFTTVINNFSYNYPL